MNQNSTLSASPRLYYFDWLRGIAFLILLFVHCAEVFVNWNFWIKNEETSDLVSFFTAFFLPWRMPLLFIISGAVVSSSFKRKTVENFLQERFKRLMVPLLFAIFVVIPPQIYFIKKYRGSTESFVEFYQSILQFNWHFSPKGNLHFIHLWYLAYLLVYSLVFLPVLLFMRTDKGKYYLNRVAGIFSRPYIILFLGVLVNLPYYLFTAFQPLPDYPALFLYYFPIFICGGILWSNDTFRGSLSGNAYLALPLACVSTFILYYLSYRSGNPEFYFQNLIRTDNFLLFALKSSNQWFWILTFFGLAKRFLNFNSSSLSFTTSAVYPFYILHQTFIVAFGYYIIKMNSSIFSKLALLTILTFFCMISIHLLLLKRIKWLGMMFGVKPEKKEKPRGVIVTKRASAKQWVVFEE
ncbi:acyltransferase family protein [Desertivirga arenae]|uniref:acyltransferase family protein n=1 Tax=Desertivirga arenae TaxID=2810309 RepID=UPI001A968501|nr:acyltransferase family protein [Pedobacter sp. SYSU D00823]